GLLIASDELFLKELSKRVQYQLIEKQTSWIQENFVPVLQAVSKLSCCEKLRDYCFKCICEDPKPLINSKEFTSLDKDILYSLLKRDDLQIEEIVAWDSLIRWGIAQTGSSSNFEALKETLSEFIPIIRFSGIGPEDFFDKVF